jgi:hypothetical protein
MKHVASQSIRKAILLVTWRLKIVKILFFPTLLVPVSVSLFMMWQVEGRKEKQRGFYGASKGKRSLGTPRHKWENVIEVFLKEMYLCLWIGSE